MTTTTQHDAQVEDKPWRAMADFPRDGSINAICFREWNIESNPLKVQLAQWIDLYGDGGKLCSPNDYDNSPFADGWLPLSALSTASVPPQALDTGEVRWASNDDPVGALAIRLAARATALEEEHGEWTWRDIARAALDPQGKV